MCPRKLKALGGRGGWEGAGGLGSPAKYKSKLLGVLPGAKAVRVGVMGEAWWLARAELSSELSSEHVASGWKVPPEPVQERACSSDCPLEASGSPGEVVA